MPKSQTTKCCQVILENFKVRSISTNYVMQDTLLHNPSQKPLTYNRMAKFGFYSLGSSAILLSQLCYFLPSCSLPNKLYFSLVVIYQHSTVRSTSQLVIAEAVIDLTVIAGPYLPESLQNFGRRDWLQSRGYCV